MNHVKAPYLLNFPKTARVSLFLAGSIEMGTAEDWQSDVVSNINKNTHIKQMDLTVFNPRRDDWDSSWVQDPTPGSKFNEQVNWELTQLENSDIIIFNFSSGTISPITLMEFGLHIPTYKRKLIVCPTDYHRYGNVLITASRMGKNYSFHHERDDKFYTDLFLSIQQLEEERT